MDLAKFERLVESRFQIVPLPNVVGHVAIERDGFAALVPVENDEFGTPGSAGLLTVEGLAVLVWRGDVAWFVARGYQREANVSEVQAIRQFAEDLKKALTDPGERRLN